MIYPEQARLVKQARAKTGLTLRDFSLKIGIQITRLHRLESGKVEMTLAEAFKILIATGTDVFRMDFLTAHLAESEKAGRVNA